MAYESKLSVDFTQSEVSKLMMWHLHGLTPPTSLFYMTSRQQKFEQADVTMFSLG